MKTQRIKNHELRILLVGGGSGGPVAPLLAVAEEIKQEHPKAKFLLIGTDAGPEKLMARQAEIPFNSIYAGKLRRYFSIKNLVSPLLVLIGFFQAIKLIRSFKPAVAFGAGSFVQVPVLYAAKFLGVPIVIHQQDVIPSFANTLCAPIASRITVSFEHSVKSFFHGSGLLPTAKKQKIVFTGNPFREQLNLADKEKAQKFFKLSPDWPTLLVLGGGTGAKFINKMVRDNLDELTKIVQIIHVTGKGKLGTLTEKPNYHVYEFMSEIDLAYAVSNIVISRAGLSTLTELANLGKVTIIIPMPKTHQEANAELFWQHKAAVVLDQQNFEPAKLPILIKKLLFNHDLQKTLTGNIKKIMPKEAAKKIADIIIDLKKI